MTDEDGHRFARERGTSRALYEVIRYLLLPIAKVWCRLSVEGAEHVPREGGVIVAPNHKSVCDPFLIGLAMKRHVHFMAKTELFRSRGARLLSRLGAFPVERGIADPEALETARIHLERGRVVAMFPEGTRQPDPDRLRTPRRGAGRLAIETRAPIVPCAITGTERLPRPVRVRVAFAEPVSPARLEATPQAAAALIEEHVWPEVEREFRRLRARRGLIAAGFAAVGIGGGVAYEAQRRHHRKPRRPWRRTRR